MKILLLAFRFGVSIEFIDLDRNRTHSPTPVPRVKIETQSENCCTQMLSSVDQCGLVCTLRIRSRVQAAFAAWFRCNIFPPFAIGFISQFIRFIPQIDGATERWSSTRRCLKLTIFNRHGSTTENGDHYTGEIPIKLTNDPINLWENGRSGKLQLRCKIESIEAIGNKE